MFGKCIKRIFDKNAKCHWTCFREKILCQTKGQFQFAPIIPFYLEDQYDCNVAFKEGSDKSSRIIIGQSNSISNNTPVYLVV